MSRRGTLVLAVLVAALFGSPAALADETRGQAEARRRFKAGEAHYQAGRFAEALSEYAAGYKAVPLPGFLVNIAQCHRRMGELRKARATYQKFIVVAPDSPLRPEVEGLIAELDELIRTLDEESRPPPPLLSQAPPPVIAPPPPAPTLVVAEPAPAATPSVRSSRVWWWTALGAAVVGGTVVALVASSGGGDPIRGGSIGSLRR